MIVFICEKFLALAFRHSFLSCDTLSESVFITQRHRDFFKWSSQSTQSPCSVSEGTEDIEPPRNKWSRHNGILFSSITIVFTVYTSSEFRDIFYFLSASTSSVSPVPINHSVNSENSHLKRTPRLCVIKTNSTRTTGKIGQVINEIFF